MKHYDPEMSQIVIPDRGKIPVYSASVRRLWGLPNKARKVCFEMNPDIINEFNSIYKIKGKNAPTLIAWCKMIKEMNGRADDNFLRAWLAVAFSCFLAPTTSLSISPRCYTAVMYTYVIKNTNICDFVIDQLRLAFMGFGDKKKVVCCCVFHLVIMYLDSLDVDEPIPGTVPRASVWNSDLITKVMKKDRKGPGEYSKLRLKTEFSLCANESLFGSLDHVRKFVAARLPETYDKNKQLKLTGMVHEMCTEISHAIGKLVHGISQIDDEDAGTSKNVHSKRGTSSQPSSQRKNANNIESDSSSSEEETYKSDEDSEEEEETDDEDSEDKETDAEKGDTGIDSDKDDQDDDDSGDQGGNASEHVHEPKEHQKEDEEKGEATDVQEDSEKSHQGGNDSKDVNEGKEHEEEEGKGEGEDNGTEEEDEG